MYGPRKDTCGNSVMIRLGQNGAWAFPGVTLSELLMSVNTSHPVNCKATHVKGMEPSTSTRAPGSLRVSSHNLESNECFVSHTSVLVHDKVQHFLNGIFLIRSNRIVVGNLGSGVRQLQHESQFYLVAV